MRPGHRPTGMCFDGRFLWITDRDSGRVDRFDPEVEEITRSVQAPGFSPCGLAWDGRNMWVTDSGTGRMYRLVGLPADAGARRWTPSRSSSGARTSCCSTTGEPSGICRRSGEASAVEFRIQLNRNS